MTKTHVAIPAGFLLFAISIPSIGQTPPPPIEDHATTSFVDRTVQTPAQVATSPAVPVDRRLNDEEMGDLFMIRKQYREAADAFKHLAEANPRNAIYLNKLGIALHQQDSLTLALHYYQLAAKADPRYADAENNIGTVWYQRKKFRKAIKAYQKAIGIRSDLPVLYSNLGYAYFGDHKYEDSIASFRKALTLDPRLFEHAGSRNGSILQDRSVSDRGRFYFLLAKSYAEAGNLERCMVYLRKAKDDGYKELNQQLKSDPTFAAVLKDPGIEDILAPPRHDTIEPETAHP